MIKRSSSHKSSFTDDNDWAVSYGDIVILLLVFSIMLASTAEVNSSKFERLKKAFIK